MLRSFILILLLGVLRAVVIVRGFSIQLPSFRPATRTIHNNRFNVLSSFPLNFNLVAAFHDSKHTQQQLDENGKGQIIHFFHSVSESPRLWLESQPDGAYTVLRCDWFHANASWNVWGREFHLHRLKTSYQIFISNQLKDVDENRKTDDKFSEAVMHRTIQDTRLLIDQLLQRTERIVADDGNNLPAVFMLTILWHPNNNCTQERLPFIQGHICPGPSSRGFDDACDSPDLLPFRSYDPIPLTAIIALPPPHRNRTVDGLPDRNPNPQAKLSSWCRERRLLEQMLLSSTDTTYNVQEIFLVGSCSSSSKNEAASGSSSEFVLLEGLTSNIFVLYRDDKSLRTSPDEGVLPGYARHLVLQSTGEATANAARLVGYRKTICTADVEQWEQVFITSSIRLVIPIQRMLVPIYKRDHSGDFNDMIDRYEVFWTQKSQQPSVWKPIYHTLIQMEYGAKKKHE
jgi:hypothetical protein